VFRRAACSAPALAASMFVLKLPSQVKPGAAETLHSEKKARGELVEIVDPTAHLPWRQNKGGPVWGSKGAAATEAQQANPAPDSPPVVPGDKPGKPGWNVAAPVPACPLDPELKVNSAPSAVPCARRCFEQILRMRVRGACRRRRTPARRRRQALRGAARA